jgi:uncharacterized protein
MDKPVSDLGKLLATMEPVLNPVEIAYVLVPPGAPCPVDLAGPDVVGAFREPEGLTVILHLDAAERMRLPILFRAAWITLSVHSDLEAVGLTAAFASALGADGISCNVVAASFHDHIFVPVEAAERAMAALRNLQRQSSAALAQ